jgi:hypothetical protein
MVHMIKLAGLILGATAINLPLGYLRYACKRFTPAWFLFVHLSIPFILLLRVKADFSWRVIPFTIGGALIGQYLGGVLREKGCSHV